jgi:hypothetical protein
MTRILCPSLIASAPGHPFWDVVLGNLRYYHEVTDVLDATGPFLLTRSLDELAEPGSVRLLPAREVYPIGFQRMKDGELFDLRRWDELSRTATALHHWDGSWIDQESWHVAPAAERIPRAVREQPVRVEHPELRDTEPAAEPFPRVSALMVTRDRADKAKLAIDCFRRQSYPNKELVILDDGGDDALAQHVAALADPDVRMLRRDDRGEALGDLRNLAVEAAAGDYVCQWDDDDLYHPLRIEVQMHHLRREGAQAAFLTRWMLWWVAARRFAVGEQRLWEGSMLCRKDRMPRYPRLGVGEDTPLTREVARTTCFVGIDQPRLYLYAVHGANTWFPGHFTHFWNRAERRFEGADAERVYRELARDFPLGAYTATSCTLDP